jgi:uncharacterized protein DUF1549/uncharacterized protein DUF1553
MTPMLVTLCLLVAAPADVAARMNRLLRTAWQREGLVPTRAVDDAAFLRRAYLDITGRIPPPAATLAFVADRSPDKRARAVDALLESPSYVDHWVDHWERVLLGRFGPGDLVDRGAFRHWLAAMFARNAGWNEIVHELLAAMGTNKAGADANGAVNWVISYSLNPEDFGSAASRLFLGVQIECAKCHDHPMESWTQANYRALAAAFAWIEIKRVDGSNAAGIRRAIVGDADAPPHAAAGSELARILASSPAALDGTLLPGDRERRRAAASWMTSAENPWFKRAIVNRMWAHFLGRGFVEPVDDFRRGNPVTLPAAMDLLASDFAASGFDLKHLIRVICATDAYHRSSRAVDDPEASARLWARFPLKPLEPEVLLDIILRATELDAASARSGADVGRLRDRWLTELRFHFDVDEAPREKAADGTLAQALMLLNGSLFNGSALASRRSALADILEMPASDAVKIETLYLRTLSRRPTALEIRKWTAYVGVPRGVAASPDVQKGWRRQAYEDLLWAMLNSSEFQFNH